MPEVPTTEPLIISAPFGNYIRFDGATSTLGTFTAHKRAGRLWRILKTVRRYKRLGAWVNRIGLRNPGIGWLERRVSRGKASLDQKLLSIHGFVDEEWWSLLERCEHLSPAGIELNISCPNVGEIEWPDKLFERATVLRTPIVVKVPPVRYERLVEEALDAGLRAFHCCNTLPVAGGGMSGKPLLPLALQCVERVRTIASNAGIDGVMLIGGGGITTPADIDAFAEAGAHRFAVGTAVMHPRYLRGPGTLRAVIQRARERAT